MRIEIINGKTETVYDRADWKTCINEDFKPGDLIDAEIAWDLINAVPPAYFSSDLAQVGEPSSHRMDPKKGTYRPTFCTVQKVSKEPEVWKYCGDCFYGETTPPKGL